MFVWERSDLFPIVCGMDSRCFVPIFVSCLYIESHIAIYYVRCTEDQKKKLSSGETTFKASFFLNIGTAIVTCCECEFVNLFWIDPE